MKQILDGDAITSHLAAMRYASDCTEREEAALMWQPVCVSLLALVGQLQADLDAFHDAE